MKILHVIPSLGSGGAERFVVDLCNELSNMGHDIYLCCLYRFNLDDSLFFYKDELSPDVNIFTVDKGLGFSTQTFMALKKRIKAINPDVVHSHLRAITYLLPSMLNQRGIRFFHTIHNDASKEADGILGAFVRKFAFKRGFCHPITISEGSDESFVNFYGKSTIRKLIYNGSRFIVPNSENAVEIAKLKDNRKRIIVNIARIMPQKNQLNLIKAVAEFNDIELLLIGNCDSEYAIEVKQQLPLNCHILGIRKNPRDYMAAADAFILPSVYEGMPISLIEAFSVGCLPIVSNVGGIADMVCDGYNGLLINGSTIENIYQSLDRYMSLSDDEIATLKKNARASFHKYDMQQCALNYLKYYQQIRAL